MLGHWEWNSTIINHSPFFLLVCVTRQGELNGLENEIKLGKTKNLSLCVKAS